MTEKEIPQSILERVRVLSDSSLDEIEQAFQDSVPTSIRLNPRKSANIEGANMSYCEQGRYLSERPSFVADPAFHQGCYYVQEASSMMLECFLADRVAGQEDFIAVDLCASPGGKSTHLRSLMHEDALLVSNEVDSKRWNILAENVGKWGYLNTVCTQFSVERFTQVGPFADLVVLDAPCSGSGMMRKDQFAIQQWSPNLVVECAALQSQLLKNAWSILKPGGLLLYSTCSFSEEENEGLLSKELPEMEAEVVELQGMPSACIRKGGGVYMLPHLFRGEGLFMALLRKPGNQANSGNKARVAGKKLGYLVDNDLILLDGREERRAIASKWESLIGKLQKFNGRCLAGTGYDLPKSGIPHPELALSIAIDTTELDLIELDKQEALKLLQGDVLRRDVRKGMALACYQGQGLMWLKGAGNRWNNHWPKNWRIRKHL